MRYAVAIFHSRSSARPSTHVTASASTPPFASIAYRVATASNHPTRNAPCHPSSRLSASRSRAVSPASSVTSGPSPCRVAYARTTPQRATAPSYPCADSTPSAFSAVHVLHVVCG